MTNPVLLGVALTFVTALALAQAPAGGMEPNGPSIFIGDSGGNQDGQKAVADKLTAQFAGRAI